MRLPIPDPREVIALAARGPELAEALVTALPRTLALLDDAEALVARISAMVDEVEVTRQAATAVVRRTEETVESANALIVRTAGTVASVEPTLKRSERLIDSFAPPLERLQPLLDRLAETTDTREVDALVTLIDHLPHLVERLETDVVPMLANLQTVAPDIHDMLEVVLELSDMLGKLPGMGRLKRRVEDQVQPQA